MSTEHIEAILGAIARRSHMRLDALGLTHPRLSIYDGSQGTVEDVERLLAYVLEHSEELSADAMRVYRETGETPPSVTFQHQDLVFRIVYHPVLEGWCVEVPFGAWKREAFCDATKGGQP